MAIPYFKQQSSWTCGPASLRMVLASFGIKISEAQLAKALKTNRIQGTAESALPLVAKQHKLTYHLGRDGTFAQLQKFLKQRYQIIVSYYIPEEKTGHFSVLKRISKNTVYFLDPWYGPKHKLSKKSFLKVWKNNPARSKEKRWYFAVKKL